MGVLNNTPTDWSAQIAAISELPEFQNCYIEIRDPTLVTITRNIITGAKEVTGNPVVARGRARLIGTRSVTDATDGIISNETSVKPIRVQFPADLYAGRVLRGWQIRVVDGGRNPRLESMLFMVRADVQGSMMAARTVECTVDVEAVANWVEGDPGEGLLPSSTLLPSENLLVLT